MLMSPITKRDHRGMERLQHFVYADDQNNSHNDNSQGGDVVGRAVLHEKILNRL